MSFHDEPLVFDNGPFNMDVGPTHAAERGLFQKVDGTDNWLRRASDPTRILVLVKRPNGDVDDFKTTHLRTRDRPVTITLRVPGVAVDPTVTLEWGGDTRDELTIKPDGGNLKLERNGASRRLKASLPQARVARIEWTGEDNQPESVDLREVDSNLLRHDSVYVALF